MGIKIGTLTFHVAHNYGAMLQSYALPIAVRQLGVDCEVIDYRFPYIYNWGIVEGISDLIRHYGFFGGMARWAKYFLRGDYNKKKKINQFNYFRENIISHSEKAYFNKQELKELPYDIILFGSDQIWNKELTDGYATEFFGDFGNENVKRVAYAASNGKKNFSSEEMKVYAPLLKKFSGLGIREKGLTEFLQEQDFDAQQVLDPTLLLTKKQWDRMVEDTPIYLQLPKKQYLLVYAFDESKSIYDEIRKMASAKNLEIVIIAYRKKEYTKDFKVYTECGPGEFVKLFANATVVVTTSFHGTVFSILYEKDFYCVPHPKFHERTDSLLKTLGLENRNMRDGKLKETENINWYMVKQNLEKEKEKSYGFLKKMIR